MSISDPNLPPEAEFPLTPDPTATALDWLARQTGGSITGCCDDAKSDRCMPEGSAFLPDFLTRLGPDDPWPILRDLTLRGALEFRIIDTLTKDAWTPWFNPTDPGATLDVAALIERARLAVTPPIPADASQTDPSGDAVHETWRRRKMDEYIAQRAAEGYTIEPFVMDPDDKMQPGEVNLLMSPIVRLTSRGLDECRTRAVQPAPPHEPETIAEPVTTDSKLSDVKPTSDKPEPVNCWRTRGEFWAVTFKGKTITLKDIKGMAYLAELISHPCTDIQATDLYQSVTPSPKSKPRPSGDLERKQCVTPEAAFEQTDKQARAQIHQKVINHAQRAWL